MQQPVGWWGTITAAWDKYGCCQDGQSVPAFTDPCLHVYFGIFIV